REVFQMAVAIPDEREHDQAAEELVEIDPSEGRMLLDDVGDLFVIAIVFAAVVLAARPVENLREVLKAQFFALCGPIKARNDERGFIVHLCRSENRNLTLAEHGGAPAQRESLVSNKRRDVF